MFGPSKKPSRLGQWDGRRRSSRSDEPVLPHLWGRAVLFRLAAVLVTALGVTGLAYYGGPTQSFRVGEVYPHDLRARVYFEVVNQTETVRKSDEAALHHPPERMWRTVPTTLERSTFAPAVAPAERLEPVDVAIALPLVVSVPFVPPRG